MALHLLNHPLADHIVTKLRDERTPPEQFRKHCQTLTLMLALEATSNFPTEKVSVTTPMQESTGWILSATLAAVPILRAGLGMLDPLLQLFPNVAVGYVGLVRNEDTAIAHSYYCKLPDLTEYQTLLLDPMLATGGSACQAARFLKEHGAKSISMLCVVVAPEGVKLMEQQHPDIEVYSAVLDEGLNDRKYIVPGLGDFGDRLYGT